MCSIKNHESDFHCKLNIEKLSEESDKGASDSVLDDGKD